MGEGEDSQPLRNYCYKSGECDEFCFPKQTLSPVSLNLCISSRKSNSVGVGGGDTEVKAT